jgi:hypothetical protein
MAQSAESLRCEGSDAIEAKRTCRERRKRVDLTKMTQLGPGRATSAAMQSHDLLFPQPLLAGAQQASRLKGKSEQVRAIEIK